MIANARPPVRQLDLPRWCRCEDGTPKKPFPSRKAARAWGKYTWGAARRFHPYRCKACDWYHNATVRAA